MQDFEINIFMVFFIWLFKIIFAPFSNLFGINKLMYLDNSKHHYTKQVIWQCGGGYTSYYAGISQAIYESYPKEILNTVVFCGSSAGVMGLLGLRMPDEPKVTWQACVDTVLVPLAPQFLHGFYSVNKGLKMFYLSYFQKHYGFLLDQIERDFFIVFNLNILFPILSTLSYSYNFKTNTELVDAVVASHGIPLLLGTPSYTIFPHPTKWWVVRVDGGLLLMYLGYLLGYNNIAPYGDEIPCGVITPIVFKRPFSITNCWINTDPDFNKMLHEMGYKDAMANREIMDSIILP